MSIVIALECAHRPHRILTSKFTLSLTHTLTHLRCHSRVSLFTHECAWAWRYTSRLNCGKISISHNMYEPHLTTQQLLSYRTPHHTPQLVSFNMPTYTHTHTALNRTRPANQNAKLTVLKSLLTKCPSWSLSAHNIVCYCYCCCFPL